MRGSKRLPHLQIRQGNPRPTVLPGKAETGTPSAAKDPPETLACPVWRCFPPASLSPLSPLVSLVPLVLPVLPASPGPAWHRFPRHSAGIGIHPGTAGNTLTCVDSGLTWSHPLFFCNFSRKCEGGLTKLAIFVSLPYLPTTASNAYACDQAI